MKSICVCLETSSLDEFNANLVGISLAVEPGIACYIPVGHVSSDQLLKMKYKMLRVSFR